MALLASLKASRDSGVIEKNALFCVHVEHGIRPPPESRGDAEFVREFCEDSGIDCRVKHVPPGKIEAFAGKKKTGIEAAARYFRHKILRKEAARLIPREDALSDQKNAVILLAHTKDDLLETILMRILRGAGPAGLSAMSGKTGRIERLTKGNEQSANERDRGEAIARPLLGMTRKDVVDYLTLRDISWREDSTNSDEKFSRNRIRRRLVPLLNDFFPEWKTGVASAAETQSLVNDFLADQTRVLIKWEKSFLPQTETSQNAENQKRSAPFLLLTEEERFFSQPEIIREEAVFQGMDILLSGRKYPVKSVKRSVVRRFCSGAIKAADLGQIRICRENGKILLSRKRKENFESGVSWLIK